MMFILMKNNMSILMKNNNIFCPFFPLYILICDLCMGYKILHEFRTKVGVRLIHECDLYTSNYDR